MADLSCHNAVQKDFGKRTAIFFFLLLSFILIGCRGVPVWQREDPEDVLDGFLQTAESQDIEAMWEFLSEKTRSRLTERAEAFNARSGVTSHRGCDMLRPGHVLSSTREYKKLEVASQDDSSAAVDIVLHDGSRITVRLHREAGRWVIDLPSV